MRLQFSHESDRDLDRLFKFLTESSHSLKIADKALLALKNGAISLLDNPNSDTEMRDTSGRRELFIPFGKNNYVIRYHVDFELKVIRMLRIWHSQKAAFSG